MNLPVTCRHYVAIAALVLLMVSFLCACFIIASYYAFIECKAVYATMMLVHLLPDARSATNTTKIMIFTNVRKCIINFPRSVYPCIGIL